MVDSLVDALKSHDGYKQHLVADVAPVAECIVAEYNANVQSATNSALRNESVVDEPTPRTPWNVRAALDARMSAEHEGTARTYSPIVRKESRGSPNPSYSSSSTGTSTHG